MQHHERFALVVGGYAAGRFVMFLVRDDSPHFAPLGLAAAEWASLLVLAGAIAVAVLSSGSAPSPIAPREGPPRAELEAGTPFSPHAASNEL